MKKLFVFLFLISFFCITNVFAIENPFAQPNPIVLRYSIVGNTYDKIHLPRTPASVKVIYQLENEITFDPYDITFSIELLEVNNEEMVYHHTILAGDTSLTLPNYLQGTYIIKLVYGPYMYWGYITL